MHISRKHYCDSLYSKIIGHFLVVGIFTGSAAMVLSESDLFRGHLLTLVLDLALAKLGILIYFNFLKHSIFDYSDTSVIPVCICSNKILFVRCKWCFCCCWCLRRRWSSDLWFNAEAAYGQQGLPASGDHWWDSISVLGLLVKSDEQARQPLSWQTPTPALWGEAETTGPV